MINRKAFWIAQIVALTALYGYALARCLQGDSGHPAVIVSALVLVVHLLEIPLAFRVLKAHNPRPLRVVVCTQLFGLLWWVPAQRGLFAVR